MVARVRVVVLIAVALMAAGCNNKNYTGPTRYPLSGTVTCDGQPIDSGSISFIPANGDAQRVSGGTILDGKYLVPEDKGANAGPYRVEIYWAKPTGKKINDKELNMIVDERREGLPPRFNSQTELKAEVSETKTVFDFDLKTK